MEPRGADVGAAGAQPSFGKQLLNCFAQDRLAGALLGALEPERPDAIALEQKGSRFVQLKLCGFQGARAEVEREKRIHHNDSPFRLRSNGSVARSNSVI